VVSECKPGVRIPELCALGDSLINAGFLLSPHGIERMFFGFAEPFFSGLAKVYQKDKKMDKVCFLFLPPFCFNLRS
jgi:hypothetical protein